MFRDRPETTAGLYIFGDSSTPVYPGWHQLWSRDWVSDELDGATLGEDPTAKRVYRLGSPIGPIAPPAVLGAADCIANGERWPLVVVPTLVGGFPQDCFAGVPLQSSPIDVTNPGNWCFWATILARTYINAAGARAQVAARLGVADAGWVQAQPQGIFPANFGLVPPAPAPVVIVLAGTDNAVQWIQQIAYGIGPPRDQGTFSTHPVWYADSSMILDLLLMSGANATQDIVIVGHSLGGAIGCLVAARLRQGNATRNIQLLTLGCPRPGDVRLHDLLRTTQAVNLQDEDDPITAIPSNLLDIPSALLPFVAGVYQANSPRWVPAPNLKRIAWDGTVSDGAANPGLQAFLNEVWLFAIGFGPFPWLTPHDQTEYERRLCVPAPAPVAWADAQGSDLADGSLVYVLPNLADAMNGFTDSIAAGIPPQLRRSQNNFLTALIFRDSPGLHLQHPVCLDTDWEFVAAVDIVREPADANHQVLAAPIGDQSGGIGPSWSATSPTTGGFTVTAGGVGPTLPFVGNNGSPVLLSGSLCAGTVLARLETGVDVQEALATGGAQSFNGFSFLGAEFHASSTLGYPQLWLGEVLLYEGCLTPAQRDSVLAYLRIKWMVHGQALTSEGGDPLATEAGEILVTE